MGLFKRHESGIVHVLRRAAHWQVAALLLGACAVIAAFGDEGREILKYDRFAISNGEYWRLVSCHVTHLGYSHLALNLVGLVLVWLLVGRQYSSAQWLLVCTVSVAAVSGGFWFVDTDMLWYVGLSGILHGLLLAGAIQGVKSLPTESALICVLVIGKLGWEQLAGPLPGSESASGGTVVVNAHLYGAIGGVVAAGMLWRRVPAAPSL